MARVFLPDFNRRFTVEPTQAGSAFVPLIGVDLELLLSVQHERTVNNDSVVSFESVSLQLPRRTDRAHYVRCPVLVHEFPEGTLGVSYQGRLLARYTRAGQLLSTPAPRRAAARNGHHRGTARLGDLAPRAAPPQGSLLRLGEQLSTMWTGTQRTGDTRPRTPHRSIPPSTLWTPAAASGTPLQYAL